MYKTKYDNKGITGLVNRGNTCFLNTSIQCLSHIMPLTDYFVNDSYLEYISRNKKEFKLCKQYAILMKGVWEESCIVDPESFHRTFQTSNDYFGNYDQHDCQEALSIILDAIHESLIYSVEITHKGHVQNDMDKLMVDSINHWGKIFNDKYSIIVELFFGQFVTHIIDIETNRIISQNFEHFNILNLPINGRNLYECFNNFIQPESLDEEYKNDSDGKLYKVKRQTKISKIPQYLIIVLKRFKFNGNKYIKNQDTISFPINDLNISRYVEGYDQFNSTFDLKCIGCHAGSIDGGHYFAVCKHVNNNWYEFNDKNRKLINIHSILPMIYRNSYILIYEKR
jgi:ubiquitin carboxyl-terminal hydrolase 8